MNKKDKKILDYPPASSFDDNSEELYAPADCANCLQQQDCQIRAGEPDNGIIYLIHCPAFKVS